MKEYQRNTRECKFTDFSPETIQSFRKYFEKNELGDVESEIVMCGETDSTRLNRGFFARLFGPGNFGQKTSVFFTPQRLFWCSTDQKNQRAVLSAKFKDIEVKEFASNLVQDTGLEVFGFINQSSKKVQAFIGLGEEPFAREFKKKLDEAIESAVKPAV